MKKLKILIIWCGLTGYLIFSMGFVTEKINETICEKIHVNITDSLVNRFIQDIDIKNVLLENNDNILGYRLSGINTRDIETLLSEESFIKEAQVYTTINGMLNIDIVQRNPILRVMNNRGENYYIDENGIILPLSNRYTSRVLVANGRINEPFVPATTRSIFDGETGNGRRDSVISELYELAKFISESELWSSQIVQVYVNNNYEYELIPRVGAHIIYLGDANDYEIKFKKLEALYLHGFNSMGWNNYETINLKYKNQVVCTKR